MEDHVLGGGTVHELAVNLKLDGRRHLEPCSAGGEAHARIGRAHARGERAERAVRAGMRVGANHQVARHHDALLGQQRVLDTGATLLPVVRDALLVGKVAHLLGLLGALDVLVGRVVIGNEAHAVAIEHLGRAELAEDVDGNGRRDVVREHEVQIALYELARAHLVEPRMGGQDLLRHGHWSWHVVLLISSNVVEEASDISFVLRQSSLRCARCGTAREGYVRSLKHATHSR